MDNSRYIKNITAKSYCDLMKIIYNEGNDLRDNFVFRGLEDSSYDLTPSALRKKNNKLNNFIGNDFVLSQHMSVEHAIERGFVDSVYKSIKPELDNYMGKVFEDICMSYLWKLKSENKVSFIDIGKWWGTNKTTRKEAEIDIMGKVDKDKAIFCECKWRNELVPLSVWTSLVERSSIFNYKDKEYYIFAKKGFSNALVEEAKKNKKLHLISYASMHK